MSLTAKKARAIAEAVTKEGLLTYWQVEDVIQNSAREGKTECTVLTKTNLTDRIVNDLIDEGFQVIRNANKLTIQW